jgi:hypothetical protein
MSFVVARMILAVAFVVGCLSPASGSTVEELPVTIQIHDYSHVPAQSLERARDIVTRMYEKIGVRTTWLGVVRPKERRSEPDGPGASRVPVAQLTIIILTPKMAARAHVPDIVLGYAAVADEGMGRIAFTIYDRVRATAMSIPVREDELLGFVMAHEIAHLLLPRGSVPGPGPATNHWHAGNMRGLNLPELEFSELQASQMRSTLEGAMDVVQTR